MSPSIHSTGHQHQRPPCDAASPHSPPAESVECSGAPPASSPPHDADSDAEKAEAAAAAAAATDSASLTYPEGGLAAYLVVLGSWASMAAGFGIVNTIGVFEAYLSAHQLAAYPASTTGWIFGLLVFLVFFAGVQIGPVFDAYGPRALVAAGSLALVAALFTLGLCSRYWHFLLNLGLLTGLAASLLFTPAIAAVSHWFDRRRGAATGLAATGGSAGGVAFPLLLQALLPRLGWAGATRVLAAVVAALCTLAVLLCRARLPPRAAPSWRSVRPDARIFADGTGAMAVTTAGIFFVEWAYFVPITYLPAYYLARQGLRGDVAGPGAFAYQLLAIVNAASCVGRWLPGVLADRWGRYNTMAGSVALCAAAVLGLWLGDAVAPRAPSGALLVVFAVVFGFASGGNISLTPICVGQLCDTRDYGRYYAGAYTVVSVGSLTGIPIAGALLRTTGQEGREAYWGVIVFTGACYIAALGCFVWVRLRIKGFTLAKW